MYQLLNFEKRGQHSLGEQKTGSALFLGTKNTTARPSLPLNVDRSKTVIPPISPILLEMPFKVHIRKKNVIEVPRLEINRVDINRVC